MTTNKTIDGVHRDTLDRALNGSGLEKTEALKELRALLDSPEPAWNPHPDVANLAALLIELAQQGIKVTGGKGDEPWCVIGAKP